jgi:hypothetical protein
MGYLKFLSGFLLGCGLIACAALPTFSYKFFNISGNNFAGTLLGPTQQDDVPFNRCAPVNGVQQCVVVFYTELNALIKDYKQTKSDLITCQKGG